MENEIEPRQSQTYLSLPSDFSAIVEFAHRFPRNVEESIGKAKKEIEIVPGLAGRSYYSIPYNAGRQNETRVEGISIWGIECLLRHYKNMVALSRFNKEEDDYIYIDGLCFDAENNILTILQARAWKFYKPRDSNRILLLDPTARRNLEMATQSKIRRNAIIHSLPDY